MQEDRAKSERDSADEQAGKVETEKQPKSSVQAAWDLRWPPRFIALLLLVAGLTISPWALGRAAAVSDSDWDYWPVVLFLTAEAILIVLGLFWLIRRPSIRLLGFSSLLILPLIAATAAGTYGTVQFLFSGQEEEELARIGRSERLYLALSSGPTSVLKRTLSASVNNLEVPDVHSQVIFTDSVAVTDLVEGTEPTVIERLPQMQVKVVDWAVEHDAREVSATELNLWRPLLDQVRLWKRAKFYIIHSEFADEAESIYTSKMGFAGLAQFATGEYGDIHGKIEVEWIKNGDEPASEPGSWLIRSWKTKQLKVHIADQLLFADVAEDVIPDKQQCEQACTSVHEELLLQYIRTGKKPRPEFSVFSSSHHPGLSVVDIDADGFDDLYLNMPWSKNMLLRNRGDGTLEDVAADYGLDFENFTTSSVFADFDNDGDVDLFVGRTTARSLYLVNEDGKFVDRSESHIDRPLPHFVVAVSAADYDNDGLLDVAFATNGGARLERDRTSPITIAKNLSRQGRYLEKWLPNEKAIELYERASMPEYNQVTNRLDVPNVLLRNAGGGRFESPPEAEAVEVWHNTFQLSWGDYDGDGDMDLYSSNDFAPNNLLRNDGGTFVDVTEETNSADIGFGMGAAFGDYNNDGLIDLYLTNMYSKAGRRITAQIQDEEKRAKFARFARGNTLLENTAQGRFEHVSGLEPPAQMVEAAGWGWGGQFLDVNNDGYLDIYTLSGYQSAPKEVVAEADT